MFIKHNFYIGPSDANKRHRIVIDLSFTQQKKQTVPRRDSEVPNTDDDNLLDAKIEQLLSSGDAVEPDEVEEESHKTVVSEAPRNNEVHFTQSKPKTAPVIVNTKTSKLRASSVAMKPKIIIDAGHGGKDPGTIGGRNTKEKVLTLLYAKTLKDTLDNTGRYLTYLTRDSDIFVDLKTRLSIIRRYRGDLFISIHADSSTDKRIRGFSIYTLSQTASDKRTARLARLENKADILSGLNLRDEYQDTIDTLVDISRTQSMNDAKIVARILAKELVSHGIRPSGKMVKFGGFAVLTSPDTPSILLEIGFLSNKDDERMIRSPVYRKRVVGILVSSIDKYFFEKRLNS